MSGRSCSDARTVFGTGEPQLLHGPPDRRQTGRRGKRHLQFGEGTVWWLPDQRSERMQLGREHRMPPVALLAWGDVADLPPPLLKPPAPLGAQRPDDGRGVY